MPRLYWLVDVLLLSFIYRLLVYIETDKIMDYLLHVGTYIFTREDALKIYKFYSVENLTLWQIKERHYPMANLREIGVAITHGEMDLPYIQMPRFTFDPDQIQMDQIFVERPFSINDQWAIV